MATRIAIELGQLTSGLALLEEPEAHLHARGLAVVARLLVLAVKRGIVATHSLEFLDDLLDARATNDSRWPISSCCEHVSSAEGST